MIHKNQLKIGLDKSFFVLNITALIVLIIDFGFPFEKEIQQPILYFYFFTLGVVTLRTIFKIIKDRKNILFKVLIYDLLSIVFIFYCLNKQFQIGLDSINPWLRYAIIFKLIREFATPKINYKRTFLNPAQLFILSFLGISLIGTALLMLPTATNNGISLLDAFFTATSSVCVTGLLALDLNTHFTEFGQFIILVLIQTGSLGLLTFASYFSYFFKGGSSYENQLALSDVSNIDKIGEVFTMVKNILGITFIVESIGVLFIYFSISEDLFNSNWERLYFSIFHAVSAFCNAGFTTLPNGLMNENFIHNYNFQSVIIILFVFGGLGFPIVINVLKYFKYLINRYILVFRKKKEEFKPWILSLSNKLNLITTAIIIVSATFIIYIKEYYNTLQGHDGIGKFITALFTATTPRTAGFYTINYNELQFSTIMIIVLLMWIGAAPASTGGGIKTSTFAVAVLNFISLARGKNKIEIFRREVADISVRRAFATMTLSLLAIGIGIFSIAHFDSHIQLLDIAFECFSAYSTTGLSLGITQTLSSQSKFILIILMFVGRVSMLSILIAFFKKKSHPNYTYPSDEILIH